MQYPWQLVAYSNQIIIRLVLEYVSIVIMFYRPVSRHLAEIFLMVWFWNIFVKMKIFMSVRMESNISRLLVGSSRLIGFNFSTESFLVSNVMDFSVDSFLINETVTALHITMSITGFFSVLFSMVVLNMVSKVIRLGFIMMVFVCFVAIMFPSEGQSKKGGENNSLDDHVDEIPSAEELN
ncbi:hypothetical protein X975_09531, partial [Stegodyphus mimosarum]